MKLGVSRKPKVQENEEEALLGLLKSAASVAHYKREEKEARRQIMKGCAIYTYYAGTTTEIPITGVEMGILQMSMGSMRWNANKLCLTILLGSRSQFP